MLPNELCLHSVNDDGDRVIIVQGEIIAIEPWSWCGGPKTHVHLHSGQIIRLSEPIGEIIKKLGIERAIGE